MDLFEVKRRRILDILCQRFTPQQNKLKKIFETQFLVSFVAFSKKLEIIIAAKDGQRLEAIMDDLYNKVYSFEQQVGACNDLKKAEGFGLVLGSFFAIVDKLLVSTYLGLQRDEFTNFFKKTEGNIGKIASIISESLKFFGNYLDGRMILNAIEVLQPHPDKGPQLISLNYIYKYLD